MSVEQTYMTTADAYRLWQSDDGQWTATSAHPETPEVVGSSRTAVTEQLAPGRLAEEPLWVQYDDSVTLPDNIKLVHSSLSPNPTETLTNMLTHGGLWSLRDRDRFGLNPQGLSVAADRASGWDSFVCFTALDKRIPLMREVDFQVVLKPEVIQRRSLGFLPQDVGSSYSRYRDLVAASPHSPPLLPSLNTKQQWLEQSRIGNEWVAPWHIPTSQWAAIHCHPRHYATFVALLIALGSDILLVDWLY